MIKLKQLRCSFCYKKESQVQKLVAGPHVYICNECCAIASRIMAGTPPSDSAVVEPTLWQKLRRWMGSLWHYKSRATLIDPC